MPPTRSLVLGATGGIGQHLIAQALLHGIYWDQHSGKQPLRRSGR